MSITNAVSITCLQLLSIVGWFCVCRTCRDGWLPVFLIWSSNTWRPLSHCPVFDRVSDCWCLPPLPVVCESIIYDYCFIMFCTFKKTFYDLSVLQERVEVSLLLMLSHGAQEWLPGAQVACFAQLYLAYRQRSRWKDFPCSWLPGESNTQLFSFCIPARLDCHLYCFSDVSWVEAGKVRRRNPSPSLAWNWQWRCPPTPTTIIVAVVILQREICTCLELVSPWEHREQKQRPAHPEWVLPKLLTTDICEAVSHSGGMWKWAPAESPSKMIPLGCEPKKHNSFTLFMYSSSGQPPEWVTMWADSVVCIECTVHPNSDTVSLFMCWRVWGEHLGGRWNFSAIGTAS